MTREEAIEYWEGLRKTFSSQLEKEENHFGRMHLQTTIDAIDMAISALRHQDVTDKYVGKMTNAQKIRAMNDEELAEFLADADAEYCHVGLCEDGETCRICCLRWLQMPAEEDDHDERKENENV